MQALYIVMHVDAVFRIPVAILHNLSAVALLLPFCIWLHRLDCDDSWLLW